MSYFATFTVNLIVADAAFRKVVNAENYDQAVIKARDLVRLEDQAFGQADVGDVFAACTYNGKFRDGLVLESGISKNGDWIKLETPGRPTTITMNKIDMENLACFA